MLVTIRSDEKVIAPSASCQEIFQHFPAGAKVSQSVSFLPLENVLWLARGTNVSSIELKKEQVALVESLRGRQFRIEFCSFLEFLRRGVGLSLA
jgi:hypothetical protein